MFKKNKAVRGDLMEQAFPKQVTTASADELKKKGINLDKICIRKASWWKGRKGRWEKSTSQKNS